jgi:hypothetical protein
MWTRHDQADRNDEEPLLLDPCADDPGEYLEVVEVDGKAVVREKQPAGTRANQRAHSSIAVFGLNRSKLEEERRQQRLLLLDLFRDVRHDIKVLDHLPAGPMWEETKAHLLTKLGALKEQRRPASPYLLMKLPLIDGFMAEVGPDLTRPGVLSP